MLKWAFLLVYVERELEHFSVITMACCISTSSHTLPRSPTEALV